MKPTQIHSLALLQADGALHRVDLLLHYAIVALGDTFDETTDLVEKASFLAQVLVARRTHETTASDDGMSQLSIRQCVLAALREANSIDVAVAAHYPEITKLRVLLDEAQHNMRNDQP